MFFSSKNGHFFNINGACKAIDVDTRREVVIKTWKTSANNRSFSISQESTAQYFYLRKYCAVGSWEIEKYLLLELVFHVFITTSRLVSTSIALHAPLILKNFLFYLRKF